MALGVDMSHWGGPLTGEEARCLQQQGFSLVIANTHGGQTRQQLETAKRNGLRIQAYVYLYWGMDQTARVLNALSTISGLGCEMLWLDAEDDPGGRPPSVIVAQLKAAQGACGTMPCGIYTRGSWWRPYAGNASDFAMLPLWDADYDERASYDGYLPYGGWRRPLIKQFGGTRIVCGQSVDVNYFEEDGMSSQEYNELRQLIAEVADDVKALTPALFDIGSRLGIVENGLATRPPQPGAPAPPVPAPSVNGIDRRAEAIAFSLQTLITKMPAIVHTQAVQGADALIVADKAAALLRQRGCGAKVKGGQVYAAATDAQLP
ncbi:MAG: GH25 family lysozyme [Dehalococcoidia bacterium]